MEFFFIIMLMIVIGMIVIGMILTLVGLDDSIKPKGYDTTGKDEPAKDEAYKITLEEHYPELQKFTGLDNVWYTDEKGDLFSLHIEIPRRCSFDGYTYTYRVKVHKFTKLSLCSETVCTFEIEREVGVTKYKDHLLDTDSIIKETISGYENLPKGKLKKSEIPPKDIYWKEILESQFRKEQEYIELCENFVDKVKVRYAEYKEVCIEFGKKPKEPITDIYVFGKVVYLVGLDEEYTELRWGHNKAIKWVVEILNRKD